MGGATMRAGCAVCSCRSSVEAIEGGRAIESGQD